MILALFWKAINTLTNKDASKPQVTVKELPPEKLNSHFANVSDTIITKDQSKLNDLSFLKRFYKSKISNSTLKIPPIAIYEVTMLYYNWNRQEPEVWMT